MLVKHHFEVEIETALDLLPLKGVDYINFSLSSILTDHWTHQQSMEH